ncbi:DNA sulfur modification protein DndB [Burkholderia ubonensis]|uniref:DNA sulfur modification protein DndB n=1 Tax=Burkholderia ubonensis TaxID=101571 RepID=UPI000758AC3A|nr:DNA sulfur modification protein DndB [Burkholderia ubonensis]KVD14710.1 DNA sulfur modification protein DndB [Burkholderia ubonensis]
MDEQGYFHTFPAAQGRQAGRDFFIAMCPLRMVPRLFVFDEEEVPPELRAQRTLNRARVPEIAHYLTSNPTSYVLSALTASVDARVRFVPYDTGSHTSLGHLQIPMDARILINDGQHRRAAIEEAIRDMPELGQDNIPVLFFVDEGLVRSQQMFADLNKYAVRPSNSLGTLYDYRDPGSDLARYLAAECLAFRGLTEMEKSSISNRSTKLFTLSSIKHASRALLRKQQKDEVSVEEKLVAKEYWDAVAENIPDWGRARSREASTAELRQEFVHAHGVTLHALGIAGAELLSKRPKNWKSALKALRQVDWSRSNHKVWEGRAMVHGRISKASTNVQLTANCIKTTLGLTLSPDDKVLEQQVQ